MYVYNFYKYLPLSPIYCILRETSMEQKEITERSFKIEKKNTLNFIEAIKISFKFASNCIKMAFLVHFNSFSSYFFYSIQQLCVFFGDNNSI